MEECALRRLPKDILIKLISHIQDPDKMSDEYLNKYSKKIMQSVKFRKVSRVKPLLETFFNNDIFQSLKDISTKPDLGFLCYRFLFGNITVKVVNASNGNGFSVIMDKTIYARQKNFFSGEEEYYNEKYEEKVLGKYVKFGKLCLSEEGIGFLSKGEEYLKHETDIDATF